MRGNFFKRGCVSVDGTRIQCSPSKIFKDKLYISRQLMIRARELCYLRTIWISLTGRITSVTDFNDRYLVTR